MRDPRTSGLLRTASISGTRGRMLFPGLASFSKMIVELSSNLLVNGIGQVGLEDDIAVHDVLANLLIVEE